MKIHIMVRIVKKKMTLFLVYLLHKVADVFRLYCRVWNNRIDTII